MQNRCGWWMFTRKKDFLISRLWYFQWKWKKNSTKTNKIFCNTRNYKQHFETIFGPESLKKKVYNSLAVPILLYEAKFEPLKKRIQNVWHHSRLNISEKQTGAPVLTTERTEECWKIWKQNQLTRNDEDTNQIGYDM